MTYSDEYDEYDEYDEDEDYPDEPPRRSRALERQDDGQIARRAIDWGVSGSIIAIVLLTAIYAFSPVDFVPDFIPLAGQADDIAAITAGGGSVLFLTVMRYILRALMGSRAARWGCLIFIVLASIGAFAVFWALLELLNRVF